MTNILSSHRASNAESESMSSRHSVIMESLRAELTWFSRPIALITRELLWYSTYYHASLICPFRVATVSDDGLGNDNTLSNIFWVYYHRSLNTSIHRINPS